MRVLQLIDSLRSGGAERMAVTYANAFAKRSHASFLCCTRTEGLLKEDLQPEVGYLFLNKKSTLDLQAFLKLRKFVKENKIELIQAHSSSWFLALLVKLNLPGLKLVWHDHYGRNLNKRRIGILRPASQFFDGIISVNVDLKEWAEKNLKSKKVQFFRNFLSDSSKGELVRVAFLKGQQDAFRILCLANLRPQKDHMNLLKAFETVQKQNPQASLHLIGKDEGDDYSTKLKTFVRQNDLESKVFFYGEKQNVQELLLSADLGVLSSSSEGLPLALLEYGNAGLPVVCTAVGECPQVIGAHGLLVPPADPVKLSEAILFFMKDDNKRKKTATNFQKLVQEEYSENEVLQQIGNFFREILVE